MTGHDRALELAAAALDFDLEPAERRLLAEHLEGCPSCRRFSSGLATDSQTIAVLPYRRLQPARADAMLAEVVGTRAEPPILRYLAIAALLALLATSVVAVGAELVRRLDGPPQPLVVAPSPRASDPAPSATPDACPTSPTISDLASFGGDGAAACYGSAELDLLGFIPTVEGSVESCPGRAPMWLSCDLGLSLASGPDEVEPLLHYAYDGEAVATGAGTGRVSEFRGRFARFTAHFDDASAAGCLASDAGDPYFDDPEGLKRLCRETLVVTGIEVLAPDEVPQPSIERRWTLVAGSDAFGAPANTALVSLAELGGTLFAVSLSPTREAVRFWSSSDGRAWQEVDTGDFTPTDVVSDGTRLIALSVIDTVVETATSTDGRTWARLPGMSPDAQPSFLVATPRVVFAAGTDGLNAGIWKLGAVAWQPATIDDGGGFLSEQDAQPARVADLVSDTRGYVAIGEVPPAAGFGFVDVRIWSSPSGDVWTVDDNVPDAATHAPRAAVSPWADTSIVIGTASDRDVPAAWIRRNGTWEAGVMLGGADRGLPTDLVLADGVPLAIGYDDRTFEGQPFRTAMWGSSDGAAWWPMNVGDLEQGVVDDVIVTGSGRIVAAGRQFLSGTPSWESPHGPAVYELLRSGG